MVANGQTVMVGDKVGFITDGRNVGGEVTRVKVTPRCTNVSILTADKRTFVRDRRSVVILSYGRGHERI